MNMIPLEGNTQSWEVTVAELWLWVRVGNFCLPARIGMMFSIFRFGGKVKLRLNLWVMPVI